jgi:hypothetical protein
MKSVARTCTMVRLPLHHAAYQGDWFHTPEDRSVVCRPQCHGLRGDGTVTWATGDERSSSRCASWRSLSASRKASPDRPFAARAPLASASSRSRARSSINWAYRRFCALIDSVIADNIWSRSAWAGIDADGSEAEEELMKPVIAATATPTVEVAWWSWAAILGFAP